MFKWLKDLMQEQPTDEPKVSLSKEETFTERSAQFSAGKLVLENVGLSKVTVAVGQQPGISVTVSGKTKDVTQVLLREDPDQLVVHNQNSPSTLQVVTIDDVTYLNGKRVSDEDMPHIRITVPKYTPVSITGTCYMIQVGDTLAELTGIISCLSKVRVGAVTSIDIQNDSIGSVHIARANGSCEIRNSSIGKTRVNEGVISKLRVYINGTGGVYIGAQVNGKASIFAQSVGDVRLQLGVMDQLSIQSSGTGSVKVGGIAQNITIDSRSIGHIGIDHASGNVAIRASGTGHVTLASGDLDHLSVKCSGPGNVTVNATADSASLSSSSVGDIRVKRVLRRPEIIQRSVGKITIYNPPRSGI